MSLFLALSALPLIAPALSGKFLGNDFSDQLIAGYAFRSFAAESTLVHGEVPQWNPYLFGGMPHVAAMHGDIFYPTALLRLVLPVGLAMTLGMVFHLLLAGAATYWFLRLWRLEALPALIGGSAYMLSGPVATMALAGHDGKLFVSALMPLALSLLTLGLRDRKKWVWGALALLTGLGALSPHPQLLQYSLIVSGAFALFLWIGEPRTQGREYRRIGFALGAVVLGLMIGAVQYIPVGEYVPWSPRAGGLSGWEHSTSYSLPPEELFETMVPGFAGSVETYWGRTGIKLHGFYFGALTIVFALVGAVVARRQRFVMFWVIASIVGTFWAMGGYTPFYKLVYWIVPGTKFFRAPSTVFFVTAFGVSALAAIGVDRLRDLAQTKRALLVGAAVVGLPALLAGTGGLQGVIGKIGGVNTTVLSNAELELAAARIFALLALAGLAVWLNTRKILTINQLWLTLAILLAGDLTIEQRHFWRYEAPAEQTFARNAIVDELARRSDEGRVLPFNVIGGVAGRDVYLGGTSGLMAHGIRLVTGYHGNELGRYQDFYDKRGTAGTGGIANASFQRLTQLNFLLTDTPDLSAPGFVRTLGPVRNASGTDTYLYEATTPSPGAWVTPISLDATDEAAFATVLDSRFDPNVVAIFEEGFSNFTSVPNELPPVTGISADVTRVSPDSFVVRLDSPAPMGSALVVSENFYPGWKAYVDGEEIAVGRADYVLMGSLLPAGAEIVEFRFESAAINTGWKLSLLAILGSLVWIALGLGAKKTIPEYKIT